MRMQLLANLTIALLAGAAQAATIEDAAWLAGRWTGTGLGGQMEEVWSPPAGGQMVGHFRLVQDGKPAFYEFILLDVVDGGLRMRLKHFNPDHTAWEDKDAWTTFSPVSVSPEKLVFSALTIERMGPDALKMTLRMRREDKTVEEVLLFQRAPAP